MKAEAVVTVSRMTVFIDGEGIFFKLFFYGLKMYLPLSSTWPFMPKA